jgi:hypothetical protein
MKEAVLQGGRSGREHKINAQQLTVVQLEAMQAPNSRILQYCALKTLASLQVAAARRSLDACNKCKDLQLQSTQCLDSRIISRAVTALFTQQGDKLH